VALALFVMWVASWAYFPGITNAGIQRVARVGAPRPEKWRTRRLPGFAGPSRALFVKEVKAFFRDETQWPQLFLMGALIVIYLYNFKVLPLDKTPIPTVYLQNLFSFLNMALVGFVLTALAARFVYPAVSMEKDAFWIMRAAPMPLARMLWVKFWIYLIPLLILSEILVVATNSLLSVTPFMMGLSVITVFFMVPGIVALGVGLGAAYPDFGSENPAQAVTSFGGLMFMVLAAGFIGAVVILEAGPVYRVFVTGVRGEGLMSLDWIWLFTSFALVFVLCVLAVFWPMRFGRRRLEDR
jgi:ABC-2 type transport system permease protein